MPVYEFQCPKGHVSEDLVSMSTKSVICQPCHLEALATNSPNATVATRIMSATKTDFHFADPRK